MSTMPEDARDTARESHDGGSYRQPGKQYKVAESEPKAFMVEDAQWDRLKGRVDDLEQQPSISWLTNAVWTAFSICVSAVLAVLVLPHSKGTQLGAGVRPALWAIAGASLVVALILTGVYIWARRTRRSQASDICNEMDTIHDAWVERKEESAATG